VSQGQHDLRQLFRAVGRFSGTAALTSSPPDRTDIDGEIELLDEPSAPVEAEPAAAAAYIDGIQASLVVTHREHRPVFLSYVGAGAVDAQRRGLTVEEKLELVCSHLDREWVDGLGSSVPVDEHACELPPDVERAALQALGGQRAHLEQVVCDRVLAATDPASGGAGGLVVVDGALGLRSYDARLAGVIKTHGAKYLPDERVLYGLPQGWRSPRFRLPAGVAGGRTERFSCYLRLFDASHHAWAYGLIRIETHRLEELEPFAARCLRERQPSGSRDARGDRHLAPIRACEDLLRSRRPQVYGG
jgi:hypothetical protein